MSVHNHFYRRLQRHAQISVLMRAGQATPAPQSGKGASSPEESATTALPLVQARLASPATDAVSAPREAASQSSGEATRPPAEAPTEAHASAAPAAAPDAATSTPSADDAPAGDRSWQRLQRIIRKHESRPKTEDDAPAPPSRRAAHVLQRKPAASAPKTGRKADRVQQRPRESAVESPPAAEEGNLDTSPTAPTAPEQDKKRQDSPSPPRSPQEAAEAPQRGNAVSRQEIAQSGAPEETMAGSPVPPTLEPGDKQAGAFEQPAAGVEGDVVRREPAAGSAAEGVSKRASTAHDTQAGAAADVESPAARDADRSAPPGEARPTTPDDEDATGQGREEAPARPTAPEPVEVQRAPDRDESHDSAATGAPPAQDRPRTPAGQAPAQGKSQEEARPLQAVWPVQRKESGAMPEREPTPDPTSEKAPAPGGAQESLPDEDVASLEKVRSALETMSSGPTASGVELLLPRRPRPAMQRKAAPQDDARKEAPERKSEAVVPTDIGPLPADLWQLLDEERSPAPPSDEPAQENTTPLARQSQEPAPVQREPEATPPSPLPPLAQGAITQATQAADNEMEVQGGDETDHDESSEIDIDALARQVLTRLRRRLAVEWERGRGRI